MPLWAPARMCAYQHTDAPACSSSVHSTLNKNPYTNKQHSLVVFAVAHTADELWGEVDGKW